MAIAFDANAQALGTDPSSTFSWNHTCTGSNLILVVSVASNTTTDPTGITYNSVPMTKATSRVGSGRQCSIWYLGNPSTGTNSVAVTWAGSTAIPQGSSSSYSGCSSTIGATGVNSAASGTAISVAITTTTANSYLVGSVHWNTGAGQDTISSSGGSTVRSQQGNAGTLRQGTGDLSTPTVQSNSLAFTISASNDWRIAAIEILPFSASGPSNWKNLNTNVKANIKTLNTNTLANIKTYDTIS